MDDCLLSLFFLSVNSDHKLLSFFFFSACLISSVEKLDVLLLHMHVYLISAREGVLIRTLRMVKTGWSFSELSRCL